MQVDPAVVQAHVLTGRHRRCELQHRDRRRRGGRRRRRRCRSRSRRRTGGCRRRARRRRGWRGAGGQRRLRPAGRHRPRRFRGRSRRRMRRQQQRWARRLAEVEVAGQIPETRGFFAHVRTRVRPPIGRGIQALPVQEVVLDELQVRVVGELLMIDIPGASIGADDQAGHAKAVTVFIDHRRNDVVVEPSPIVPGEEDRCTAPAGAAS